MKKNYVYVLVYDLNGKQVIMATSNNYTVLQHKKTWYDARLTTQGKIKKLYKGVDNNEQV